TSFGASRWVFNRVLCPSYQGFRIYGRQRVFRARYVYFAYKSFESLAEVAKGPANKVFIPSNAIETLGTLGAIGEIFKEKQAKRLPSSDTPKE
ncbi:hypothetical protein ACT7CY_23320, partial [Bacillus pacificus]